MNSSSKNPSVSNVEKIGNEYWLLIPGKPSSVRARSKQAKKKLAKYRTTIRSTASQIFSRPTKKKVEVRLYHFHKGTNIDIDNIQKPILDSLTGIAYHDDNQVDDLNTKRVNVNTSTTVQNVTSRLIPDALSRKKECVVICVVKLAD